MSTDPQEFAQVLNDILDGVIVCSGNLCHIEPTPPEDGSSYIDMKDPTVKVRVLGSRDCQPCTDLKTEIGAHPKVSFIYMDDEKDPNSELGFEILERAGWSGTTPAIYLEQNGQIVGELWEGERSREPETPFGEDEIAEGAEIAGITDAQELAQELVDGVAESS